MESVLRAVNLLLPDENPRRLQRNNSLTSGSSVASNPDTVRAPDIAFIGTERVLLTGVPDKFWPGPPDLAVEVLSPEDTVYEVEEKVEEWLAAGLGVRL